jgi:hypothetical protein
MLGQPLIQAGANGLVRHYLPGVDLGEPLPDFADKAGVLAGRGVNRMQVSGVPVQRGGESGNRSDNSPRDLELVCQASGAPCCDGAERLATQQNSVTGERGRIKEMRPSAPKRPASGVPNVSVG